MITSHEANSIITLINSLLNYSSYSGEFELSTYERNLITTLQAKLEAENDTVQVRLLKQHRK